MVTDYGGNGKVANGSSGNNLIHSNSFYMQKQASFTETLWSFKEFKNLWRVEH